MLMHSCYCIFISVTGGFVQMLEDFKNLLKMSLKILFIKRKRKFPSISSPSSHSAQHQPQPSSPPLFPTRPSFAQPSNPASRDSPAPRRPKSRAPLLQPPRLPFLLQPLTARARTLVPPPSSRNRSARQPQPPPAPTSRVVGSPSPCPGLFLSEAEPPRVPLSLSAPISPPLTHRRPQPPSLGEAPPSTEIGTAVDRLPRAISDPFLPRGETPMLSSLSLSFTLAFDGLNGRFACGREALGRRPWRPPLQLSPPATFLA